MRHIGLLLIRRLRRTAQRTATIELPMQHPLTTCVNVTSNGTLTVNSHMFI